MTYVWGRFTSFHAVHNQSTSGLKKEIAGFLEKKGISMNEDRRSGYSDKATMTGAYSGLQKQS